MHPSVATILDNLALLYYYEGRYADAEPLLARALLIWKSAVGPDSPDVATNLETHAAVLRRLGRYKEAAAMESRVKTIREKYAR